METELRTNCTSASCYFWRVSPFGYFTSFVGHVKANWV